MRVKVVTGYIPIMLHPRSAKEYGELGEKLFKNLDFDGAIHPPFYEKVSETWLWKLVNNQPFKTTHSTGDNPAKNSLAYHCVQHQKFGWLLKAAIQDASFQTYVWMDYGIAHVPGVSPDVVNKFLASVKENDFAIPGCWQREGLLINDFFPCWRFCGGVLVVPRELLYKLYKGVKYAAAQHIQKTKNVVWEVNTLAEAERDGLIPPPRWYLADHNETIFTNYAEPSCSQSSEQGSQAV